MCLYFAELRCSESLAAVMMVMMKDPSCSPPHPIPLPSNTTCEVAQSRDSPVMMVGSEQPQAAPLGEP